MERYGYSVDDRNARLIDQLDEAFERRAWTITDHSMMAINRNRHMTIEDEIGNVPEGKVPSMVFDAVQEANCRVTGVHTGIDGDGIRVWFEEE